MALASDQEARSVKSAASSSGSIALGGVTTTGTTATAAHVQEAAAGNTDPATIALPQDADTYTVALDAMLPDEQYASIQTGNLYVGVYTTASAGADMREQLNL
jgi:hypothetical protein